MGNVIDILINNLRVIEIQVHEQMYAIVCNTVQPGNIINN